VRENNEDNLYVDGIILPPDTYARPFSIDGITNAPTIFAVCDGMGGESDGEIASLLAVQALTDTDERIKTTSTEKWCDIIQDFANEASEAINAEAKPYGKRMGTTIALVIVEIGGIHCFNIGDSRIYALFPEAFMQITKDHVLAGSHKLTGCIGIGDERTVENYLPITNKCRILICSDGLTDLVEASSIENAMRIHSKIEDAANELIEIALAEGGSDNITIIMLDADLPKKSLLRNFLKKMKGNDKR